MTNVQFLTRALSAPDRTLGDHALDDQRRTSQLLAWMGIEPGMTVMDIMVGTGYTIEVLSRVVGKDGKAYAVQPRALANIDVVNKLWQARLKRYQNENLVSMDGGDLTHLEGIPDESVDIVVSYLGYHDTAWMGTDRAQMNAEVRRILKPAGFYIIADHDAAEGHGDADCATLHRIEKACVQAELAAAGFHLADEDDLLSVADDTRDWNASPTGGRSGRSDRFLMRFIRADSPLRGQMSTATSSSSRQDQSHDEGEAFDADELARYAESSGVTLSEQTLAHLAQGDAGYTMAKARRLVGFKSRLGRELLQHRLLQQNPYMEWFRRGDISVAQLRAFVVQLSVVTNSSVLAMLKKMIEAETLTRMRATKEILLNALGVSYRPAPVKQSGSGKGPTVVSAQGTVDGGTFRHRTAHLEWLVELGAALDLQYEDLGRPHHANPGTLHLTNELFRLYGSGDEQVAMAASYIVKLVGFANIWATALEGLKVYNGRRDTPPVPLNFFEWHHRTEEQRDESAQDTLEEHYFGADLDEDRFIAAGKEMLEAFAQFWDGMEEQRRQLE